MLSTAWNPGMTGLIFQLLKQTDSERQLEGIKAAKERGVYRGRKPSIDVAEVQRLRHSGPTQAASLLCGS